MAVCPTAARPIANPAIPCSANGVLKTLSIPYFSRSPLVHLKTPPNLTSSPKTLALNKRIITFCQLPGRCQWPSLWPGTNSCVHVEQMWEYL